MLRTSSPSGTSLLKTIAWNSETLSSSSELLLNILGGIRLLLNEQPQCVYEQRQRVLFLYLQCKLPFAYNGSDFHDVVDINLMSLANAQLVLNVSLLEEGYSVQLSKCVYFEEWESISDKPFLLSKARQNCAN